MRPGAWRPWAKAALIAGGLLFVLWIAAIARAGLGAADDLDRGRDRIDDARLADTRGDRQRHGGQGPSSSLDPLRLREEPAAVATPHPQPLSADPRPPAALGVDDVGNRQRAPHRRRRTVRGARPGRHEDCRRSARRPRRPVVTRSRFRGGSRRRGPRSPQGPGWRLAINAQRGRGPPRRAPPQPAPGVARQPWTFGPCTRPIADPRARRLERRDAHRSGRCAPVRRDRGCRRLHSHDGLRSRRRAKGLPSGLADPDVAANWGWLGPPNSRTSASPLVSTRWPVTQRRWSLRSPGSASTR